MGAGMYPSDQLEQLPEPCIPCRLNQGLTEAARRIVDLEEERDDALGRVRGLERRIREARTNLAGYAITTECGPHEVAAKLWAEIERMQGVLSASAEGGAP